MAENVAKPKNPSRQEILDTIGDQGMDKWRNPMHLRGVDDGWPRRPTSAEEKADKRIMGMEMTPSHRNGSIPK